MFCVCHSRDYGAKENLSTRNTGYVTGCGSAVSAPCHGDDAGSFVETGTTQVCGTDMGYFVDFPVTPLDAF